jgi:hypothetical protein
MRIISNKRTVALKAHSVRLWIASVLCMLGVVGDNWQFAEGFLPIGQGWFLALGIIFGLAGLIGRFVDQDL